jgi:hypothetical protein
MYAHDLHLLDRLVRWWLGKAAGRFALALLQNTSELDNDFIAECDWSCLRLLLTIRRARILITLNF